MITYRQVTQQVKHRDMLERQGDHLQSGTMKMRSLDPKVKGVTLREASRRILLLCGQTQIKFKDFMEPAEPFIKSLLCPDTCIL